MSNHRENKARARQTTDGEPRSEAKRADGEWSVPPTAAEIGAAFGFAIGDRMEPRAIHRLRKAFPGTASMLRDVARELARDEASLRLRGVTAAGLEELHRARAPLSLAETTLMTAYRAAYEQRLALDDQAMHALRKVHKSVMDSEDPELIERWRFLGEFLSV